jgi:hypothetical protein
MTGELDATVEILVARLADPDNVHSAATFQRHDHDLDHAGLYSWWGDEEGLAVLSSPFAIALPPLIYAGQAGATSTRSRAERVATLRSRIGSNHLNGNVESSTFRKTLTAILLKPLDLRLARPGRLEPDSNKRVSAWMRCHLRIAIVPFDDRAELARLERAVLARLDPPFNLDGMPASPTRARLSDLRSALRRIAWSAGRFP